MKKVLLTLGVAMLLAGAAQAQVSYGLRGGVNLGKISNLGDNQSNNTSFHVTGYADLPVAPNFSIQPGLSLQGKGTRFDSGNREGFASGNWSRNTMSLEIPVNAVYYIPTGYSGSIFLGAGPYVGFNLSGRDRFRGDVAGITGETERSLSFSGDDRDMNVIDAGVNFLAGYRFNGGLLLNAGYGLGLTNMIPANNNTTYANRVWSFGVGFQF
ncbi:PorT family protein [Sphingobacterium sp. lm-10]|uniref:porin family protein n=1 Tax=Sphingobacterium sp. lm-10 TaxID=2944904 RepID=UPI00201FD466|nr:porin family protein [Sphingobacterium sp. lm-10]MCL7987359.1 PorT family protein [Sphingobacterium sp. lm-10]